MAQTWTNAGSTCPMTRQSALSPGGLPEPPPWSRSHLPHLRNSLPQPLAHFLQSPYLNLQLILYIIGFYLPQ